MARTALEFCEEYEQDSMAKYIGQTWFNYNSQRRPHLDAWKELRNYIFATDTTTTTNKSLPWKNSTTVPKLCQIRDNLHSNYVSALFPNDDWLKWEGYSLDDSVKQKAESIEAYMKNKTRESHFRTEMSNLLYDFIDYGNAFATVEYENSYIINEAGEQVTDYIGPKVKRISPYDIVFNPVASTFKDSFKIIRSIKTLGELQAMASEQPDNAYLKDVLNKRDKMIKEGQGFGWEDMDKSEGYMMDGFGNYSTYLQTNYVEFLEFFGDISSDDGTYERGQHVVIIDRMWVVDKKPFPNWLGHAPIYKVGWRSRTDNLWSMGPLENLVGMQYRMDHLENLKADAMDLGVMPPLIIKGDVEQFTYQPGEEIHLDENGDVQELARNVQWVIQADNSIDRLEMKMEQYAGAPREAMGIRSPGEKTAFEVQQLQNAGGRIFQEKITLFEVELLERVLNAMLEISKRNLDYTDVARVIDDDLGVVQFVQITKDDITASGKLRPIGARHFAAQAQLVQNITAMSQTPIWQQIAPHTSTKKLASLVEDVLGLQKYSLFSPNVAVFEQQETARLGNQAQEDLDVEKNVPVQ